MVTALKNAAADLIVAQRAQGEITCCQALRGLAVDLELPMTEALARIRGIAAADPIRAWMHFRALEHLESAEARALAGSDGAVVRTLDAATDRLAA